MATKPIEWKTEGAVAHCDRCDAAMGDGGSDRVEAWDAALETGARELLGIEYGIVGQAHDFTFAVLCASCFAELEAWICSQGHGERREWRAQGRHEPGRGKKKYRSRPGDS